MQPFPHQYHTTATAQASDSTVTVKSEGMPDLATNAPSQFDGPGDQWSPEELLMAAVANCFVLTFRAIARASKMEWLDIHCEATGTLDRVDRVTRFTTIAIAVQVNVPAGTDQAKVDQLLHKSEQGCLITNSLTSTVELSTQISEA